MRNRMRNVDWAVIYMRSALAYQNERKEEWKAIQRLRAWECFSAAQSRGIILG